MKSVRYEGVPTIVRTQLEIKPHYGLHCLYMPIKMAGSFDFRLPDSFKFLAHPIYLCLENAELDHYVYLSYECSYVRKGVPQKRPGIHCDGFLTEDINFIWCDKDPTLFFEQDFNIVEDCKISMEQFEAQVDRGLKYDFGTNCLLKLDGKIPHDVAIPFEDGVRQFFKVSISKDQYNLKGNTHNPDFDYSWIMHERSVVRNHPIYKEADSVPESFPA